MGLFHQRPAPASRRGYVVCFTRADYRSSASGIEKYLTEECALLAQQGISCVVVFPLRTRRHERLDAWLSQFWGVVVDGRWQGFFRAADLADWLAEVSREGGGFWKSNCITFKITLWRCSHSFWRMSPHRCGCLCMTIMSFAANTTC